jgi:ribonuclease-3
MKFMKKRILNQLINIDKVAYKEVNFKSKLLEWTQKNRVRMDFRQISQSKDETGSPVFEYVVVIEGIDGCKGKGYSKKESQQLASRDTLQRLRREPQFIDAIFAAKTQRTKMEEEPVQMVPDIEQQEDFIIEHKANTPRQVPEDKETPKRTAVEEESADEFSLDDIKATPEEKTREEIIAAAEAAAFAEG